MRNSLKYLTIPLLASIFIWIDWYVFQGVKTLMIGWGSSYLHQVVQTGYWIFFIALMASLVYGLLYGRASGKFNLFARISFHTFLTLFITQLVFLTVLFAEDIFRLTSALVATFSSLDSEHAHAFAFPARTKLMSQVGLMLAGIPFVSFIYGMAKGKYDYKVHRHTLRYNDLPEAFDGFKIVQISDVHAGSLGNTRAVQKGIDLINAQQADLFVFTGDLVNNVASEIEPWINHFSQIKAAHGKFSVLGNHDYGDYIAWNSQEAKENNLQQLKQHHADMGHRLLLDEHVVIEKQGQKLVLAGVENWGQGFTKKGNLQKALHQVEEKDFKVLLSHDPSHWHAQVKDHPTKIHLTLSGHTHGMQMGIELPGIKWSPVQYRYRHWAGLAEHIERYLYINRGFGFLGFEGRVGIWPEITVIELKK